MKMHYTRNHRQKNAKTICGKLASGLNEEDDYTGEIKNVTCKDCLNEKIISNWKKIKELKIQIKTIKEMIEIMCLILILSSCAIPKNDKNSKCLKWEFGKCVHILNKDKED